MLRTILVDVVNIRSHRRNHRRQARGFGQVADDLPPSTRVVILVDQERLDHHEDLVYVRSDEVVELVQDAVNHLDQEVALLVLERRRHEQRQDLVKQRARAELPRLVRQLTQRALALRRRTVLHLQQEFHDFALLLLLERQLLLLLSL